MIYNKTQMNLLIIFWQCIYFTKNRPKNVIAKASLWPSVLTFRSTTVQARSQKFAMGGAVLGVLFWGSGCFGRSPQPPEANGGVGAKPPAAGGTGVWGRSSQRSKILHFFCKNNFILGLFWLNNNAFKTWLRNWQCKQN